LCLKVFEAAPVNGKAAVGRLPPPAHVLLLVTVLIAVMLAGFFGMMDCMQVMAVGHVAMVPGLFVIAGFVVLGSRQMVLRGVAVVLGGFAVMIRNLF
jgi:hypothetical protein